MHRPYMKKLILYFVFIASILSACSNSENSFESNWNSPERRVWIGPGYWTNPMQDWQVEQGRLSCIFAGPDRSVHLLDYDLSEGPGEFATSVRTGIPVETAEANPLGWAGFIIGAKGEFNDYRDAAVYGKGIKAGVTTAGEIFINNPSGNTPDDAVANALKSGKGVTLDLTANASDTGNYKILLTVKAGGSGKILKEISASVPAAGINGNIALQSHLANPAKLKGKAGFWFEEWQASGEKLAHHPERNFGPVLFTLYISSKNVLKLTAQLPPVGPSDAKIANLEILSGDEWQHAAAASIDPLARTATFRIGEFDNTKDIPYRVAYSWSADGKKPVTWYYEGVIKKDPVDKEKIVVAAFTGNNDLGFPNTEVTQHVLKHDPDFLVFTGDQIYEPRGGFGTTIEPLETATLDYLRKWYMFGWEYGTMLKDLPSVCLPDDHDVYHGNLWGAGGKAAKRSEDVKEWQDDGGYKLPAEWVNMVQRTQTSHLPDPYDPEPVLQGISVYYTEMNLGGISFAVVEDRKWKPSPKTLLPASLKVANGWAESSRYVKPEILDVDADLLGKRQLDFLERWAGDWSYKTIFKSVISQTIFCTVATLPDSAQSDVVVSKLRITEKDEYPPNDIPTQDMDSDGWPKKGRDEALRVMRKAFAVHIAGDQHLASTVKYGIDEWGDAPYAICVPSISNYFPRRWFPVKRGENRQPGSPEYTGDFYDGFGNKMTVLAVANPVVTGLQPARLYDRSAGYGIIRFDKRTREIELANWPRQTDPSAPGAKPYDGWPITVSQEDNYSREAKAWLPLVRISGNDLPPVVRITDEQSGEMIYTIRLKDNTYRPKVFAKGKYRIEAGEPGTDKWKVMENIATVEKSDTSSIRIIL